MQVFRIVPCFAQDSVAAFWKTGKLRKTCIFAKPQKIGAMNIILKLHYRTVIEHSYNANHYELIHVYRMLHVCSK